MHIKKKDCRYELLEKTIFPENCFYLFYINYIWFIFNFLFLKFRFNFFFYLIGIKMELTDELYSEDEISSEIIGSHRGKNL